MPRPPAWTSCRACRCRPNCCAPSCGWPRSSTSRSTPSCCARRAPGLRHGGRRHHGRGPGDRRLRALHRPRADAARVEAHFRQPAGANARPDSTRSTPCRRPSTAKPSARLPNPLGLAGIEFVEYATSRPQALGQVLETLGFRPVARHRSREVLLYRQGTMNIVINAHDAQRPGSIVPAETPVISAVALARARRRRRLQARARPRRLGGAGAGGGDGAAHPGDPRRRRQPHLLRRPLPTRSRSGTWTSCRSPPSTSSRRPSPGCTGSAWCSTSAPTAWTTGASTTASCSASTHCPTKSASASCPRAAS